jgi:hypothetical protein
VNAHIKVSLIQRIKRQIFPDSKKNGILGASVPADRHRMESAAIPARLWMDEPIDDA